MCFRKLWRCIPGCVVLLAWLAVGGRAAERPAVPDRFALRPGEERVLLSLRVLCRQVAQAQAAKRPVPEACRTLGGLSWVEGYLVADDSAPDVILVGRKSTSRPALTLDDLVVSLRSVADGQAPYCSLDPQPQNTLALQEALQRLGNPKSPEDMQAKFDSVKNLIGPQRVVVGGVPRNSRHGWIMIAADYHMKKVSQGQVAVPGVTSVPDRCIQEAKAQFEKTGQFAGSGASMSRFWFHVAEGSPTYNEDAGIVWLETCRVVVLTEGQKATASGELHDVKQEDPQALAFARELSEAFPKLTSHVPVYAELENLFRLYAVTLAMAQRGALSKLNLDGGAFLPGWALSEEKPLRDTLPGLANYRELVQPFEQGNRRGVAMLFPMVFGGVGMDMRVEPASFVRVPGTRLGEFRTVGLTARPSPDTLHWRAPFDGKKPDRRPGKPESLAQTLRAMSTAEVTLSAAKGDGTGITLHFPHAAVRLQAADVQRLQAGQPLGSEHPLKQALVESGPAILLWTEGLSPKERDVTDRLAFALQRAYPGKQFAQSSFSPQTLAAAESFLAWRPQGLEDIVTLIAGESFDVQTWNIGNFRGALKQANLKADVRVLQPGAVSHYEGRDGKAVIVITGHIDERLAAFVRRVGESGYFRGNHVLLNTCNDPATRALVAEIIEQHGAACVFRYDRPIKAGEVEKFLIELYQRSKSGTSRPFIEVLRDLLQQHKLNGIWDICQLDPVTRQAQFTLVAVGTQASEGQEHG